MSFLSGSVSFVRYRVIGETPALFGPEHLDALRSRSIGSNGAGVDGVEVGWSGGAHVLDTEFDLAKNVLNDALHWAMRIDADTIPADLLKAYAQIEINARAALNPSGLPTKAQLQEAKEAALHRAEAEASDGRFRRMKHYPLLWDLRRNTLLIGTTSGTVLDRLLPLFGETFACSLEPITGGRLGFDQAVARGQQRVFEDLGPLRLLGSSEEGTSIAWVGDPASRDYLGNEFLLWLWHTLETGSDTLALADSSTVTASFSRTLLFDCPRAETGRASLNSEGPGRMPEARRAGKTGKLPRRAGLILVRHDQEYRFTIQAETLALSSVRLPRMEEEETGRSQNESRIDQIRHLLESFDLLYDAFGRRRMGSEWTKELGQMRRWLEAA